MKHIILILLALSPIAGFAQLNNGIQIDMSSPKPVSFSLTDMTKDIPVTVINGKNMADHPNISIEVEYDNKSVDSYTDDYNTAYLLNIPNVIKKSQVKDVILTVAIVRGSSRQFVRKIGISSDKKVYQIDLGSVQEPVYFTPSSPANELAAIDTGITNHNTVIIYRPGNNTYKIFEGGKSRMGIPYKTFWGKNAKGVVFIMNDFNTLKYDVTLTNEFVNHFTDLPDLFNTVSTLVSTGAKASSDATDLKNEVYKIMQLNSDIKKILDTAGINFELSKKQVLANARLNFGNQDGIVAIDLRYNLQKAKYIKDNLTPAKTADSATVPAPAPDKKQQQAGGSSQTNGTDTKAPSPDKLFNDAIQKLYRLPVTPDSLVSETILLYNTLQATVFRYQANIIQLQNADELQLTLNIAPKANAKNATLAVTNQLVKIPVLGGIKVDFSSGFYYSGVKNETYGLQNITVSDTAKKRIVAENGFNSGTVGISALIHIYGRMTPSANISFTFGVGKALDLNYSLLAGGSFIFGRENRFAVSGGFNFANVKMLSSGNIGSNGKYIDLPGAATDVTYYNKFRRSWFTGLSYTFGTTSAKQTAAAAPAATGADSSTAGAAAGSSTAKAGGKSKSK